MMMSMSRGLLAQIQAGKMQPKTGSLAVAGSAVSGQDTVADSPVLQVADN